MLSLRVSEMLNRKIIKEAELLTPCVHTFLTCLTKFHHPAPWCNVSEVDEFKQSFMWHTCEEHATPRCVLKTWTLGSNRSTKLFLFYWNWFFLHKRLLLSWKNDNIIIIMNSVLTILEAIYRLTPGCHGGNPSPSDTYDTYLQIFYLVEPFILDICFITNHCTQYFCSYMFRLRVVAIIREPHYTDMSSV